MKPDDNIFAEKGRASQLPQYDDVTFRNMEVVNLNTQLRNGLVFGAPNQTLFINLQQWHFHFGGLYDSTFLETEKHVKEEDTKRIKDFLKNPITSPLSKIMNEPKNRPILSEVINNALDIFIIYETAMRAAGYRNTSYMSLKKEYKHLENR